MNTNKKTPKLRFKGFTDDWEQRKLGDVAIITGGGTPSTNVPEYWNGDIDWYSPVEIGKNRYVSKSTRKITKLGLEKSSAKLLPIGTVLFTSRAGIGNTAILQAEGCTNQGFQSITPDSKELDTYFLYTMTPRLKRYGEVTGAGSTFVEVSGKQMEKMSLVLPSLEEQKQIGRFFRTIDDSITLHQRKLEKLKLNKSALLQKLFPQKGCTIPDVRFKGFTDAWEQRKFLDLLDTQNGIRRGPFGSSLKKDSFVKKSDYVVYEQQNAIYDNYVTRYFISKEKYNELIRFNIQPGDFIMSGAGTIGRISMVPDGIKKGVFNQALIRFKVDKNSVNPLYFLKFMQSDMMQKQLTQANPGSAMTNLVPMDELKKWDVTIPSLEEQNKISNFINQIDESITLHQ